MIRRPFVLLLLSIIVLGGSASFRPAQSASPELCAQDREAWLKQVLEKMNTIRPGMTRWDVLHVFRTEEGVRRLTMEDGPPELRRETFISQDCRYFRIDVEFKEGLPPRNNDVIVKVSKPYVQFASAN